MWTLPVGEWKCWFPSRFPIQLQCRYLRYSKPHQLKLPLCYTDTWKYSFPFWSIEIWNSLHCLSKFKHEIEQHIPPDSYIYFCISMIIFVVLCSIMLATFTLFKYNHFVVCPSLLVAIYIKSKFFCLVLLWLFCLFVCLFGGSQLAVLLPPFSCAAINYLYLQTFWRLYKVPGFSLLPHYLPPPT